MPLCTRLPLHTNADPAVGRSPRSYVYTHASAFECLHVSIGSVQPAPAACRKQAIHKHNSSSLSTFFFLSPFFFFLSACPSFSRQFYILSSLLPSLLLSASLLSSLALPLPSLFSFPPPLLPLPPLSLPSLFPSLPASLRLALNPTAQSFFLCRVLCLPLIQHR